MDLLFIGFDLLFKAYIVEKFGYFLQKEYLKGKVNLQVNKSSMGFIKEAGDI